MAVRYSPAFRKVAGPAWDMFKSTVTSPGFVVPGALMAAGAGANMMRDVIGDAIEAKRKAESYKAMVAAHPTLKGKPEKELRSIYNSVYNINPHMAKDPLVAGAIIDRIYTRQGMHGGSEATSNQGLLETAQELSGIRQSVSGALKSEFDVASKRKMDFARGGEVAGKLWGDAYNSAMKEHGEVAALNRQLDSIQQRTADEARKRTLADFERTTGMKPTAQALSDIRTLAALHGNPEIQKFRQDIAAQQEALRAARAAGHAAGRQEILNTGHLGHHGGASSHPPVSRAHPVGSHQRANEVAQSIVDRMGFGKHDEKQSSSQQAPSGMQRFMARFGKKS